MQTCCGWRRSPSTARWIDFNFSTFMTLTRISSSILNILHTVCTRYQLVHHARRATVCAGHRRYRRDSICHIVSNFKSIKPTSEVRTAFYRTMPRKKPTCTLFVLILYFATTRRTGGIEIDSTQTNVKRNETRKPHTPTVHTHATNSLYLVLRISEDQTHQPNSYSTPSLLVFGLYSCDRVLYSAYSPP
jgi:hypothetical protein